MSGKTRFLLPSYLEHATSSPPRRASVPADIKMKACTAVSRVETHKRRTRQRRQHYWHTTRNTLDLHLYEFFVCTSHRSCRSTSTDAATLTFRFLEQLTSCTLLLELGSRRLSETSAAHLGRSLMSIIYCLSLPSILIHIDNLRSSSSFSSV